MEHRFDELAKALAGGLSRREALRRLGGGVAAALMSTLGLGKAWGQIGAVACGDYCKGAVGFDPKDKASKKRFAACVPSCDHCQEDGGKICGTLTNGSVICCEQTDTCCGTGCCGPDQECQNGQCMTPSPFCTEGDVSASGTCSGTNATCVCPAGSFCCQGFGGFENVRRCCFSHGICVRSVGDPSCLYI
jgi:hypothetical protein